MTTGYQTRDKFFYASERLFPSWPYKTRLAIGMNLRDFLAVKEPYYRFEVNGTMYQIEANKAQFLGKKYKMKFGTLPNIIPLSEFEVLSTKPLEEKPPQMSLFT